MGLLNLPGKLENMNLSTFLGLKNPVFNFLNLMRSRVLLSYKPLSYRKNVCITATKNAEIVSSCGK